MLFHPEYQAGSIVDGSRKTNSASVIRNGPLVQLEASHIVPGDILQLEDGVVITADGVSEDCLLQIGQYTITGEASAVDKRHGDSFTLPSSRSVKLSWLLPLSVTTFTGRTAALVNKASGGQGHFTDVLNGTDPILLVLVIVSLLICLGHHYYCLPAVVTTTMAVGAAYLAKKQLSSKSCSL